MREQRIELLGKIDDWVSEHCEDCPAYKSFHFSEFNARMQHCLYKCDKVHELRDMGKQLIKLTRKRKETDVEVVTHVEEKKRGRPKQRFEIVEDAIAADNINPDHYKAGGIETIEFIKVKLTPEQYKGYLLGNVMKYTSRFQHKNGLEDLKKSRWYLERLIGVSE